MKPAKSDTHDSPARLIIYQIFTRTFTNTTVGCVANGPLQTNGSGKFADYTPRLLRSLRDMGVNCLWLTGVIEHATKTPCPEAGIPADNPNVVKGEAGSPYAIKDYYDVDPALATDPRRRMEELEELISRIHEAGMKVIIDFVPNHTARVYHSDSAPDGITDFGSADDKTKFFSPSNNYYYIPSQLFSPGFPLDAEGDSPYREFPAKATGNDCFTAFCSRTDWYETVKLNYGHDYGDHSDHFDPRPDTWRRMLHILRFWASKGVDGFRCDMVFMVPQAFWHWVIREVKRQYPALIFIGEIYDVGLYRSFIEYCGFDYLYDKVNLYDTLVGIERHGLSAAQLTRCWQTVDGLGDRMLNFLENHDEVRFASPEFAGDPLKTLPYLTVAATISRGPMMIYNAQELGERACDNEGFAGDNHRSTIFDYWSYDTLRRWNHGGRFDTGLLTEQERWLRRTYSRVLRLCNSQQALREGEFFDLMYVNLDNPDFDPHRQFAYLRHTPGEVLLIVATFGMERRMCSVKIPPLAYAMCALEESELHTTDLIHGQPIRTTLTPGGSVEFVSGGYDALIIPLKMRTEGIRSDRTD